MMIELPATCGRFIQTLLTDVPSLGPHYDEHLVQYGELLPHVFFGDLTRLIVRLCDDGPSDELCRILRALEAGMAAGDGKVQELIAVSFLENLDQTSTTYAALKGMLGPRLREELRRHE